jgi:hypothetical protein
MERWQEEVELLEEEFRRLARGCDRMAEVWRGLVAPEDVVNAGLTAYAYEKSAMYSAMADEARTLFIRSGGTWPNEGVCLEEHARSRCPRMKPESGEYGCRQP